MRVKPGVSFDGVEPETLYAMAITGRIWREAGRVFTVTSVTDGRHMVGSLHPKGFAFDGRTNDLPREVADALVAQVRDRLGPDYDVLFEHPGKPKQHMHCEYDPETG